MRRRILYIEDVPQQQVFLRAKLEAAGFTVTTVKTCDQAILRLHQESFDAVLTHHEMPHLSLQALKQVRRQSEQIPVVVLTAVDDASLIFSALELGADDFIEKDKTGRFVSQVPGVLDRAILKRQLYGTKTAMQVSVETTGSAGALDLQDFSAQRDQIMRLLGKVIDCAPVPMLAFNAEGQVLRVNRWSSSLFGLPKKVLKQKTVQSLFTQDRQGVMDQLLKDFFALPLDRNQPPFVITAQCQNRRGKTYAVELTLNQYLIAGELHAVMTIVDVSHHKQALALLKQAQMLRQSIIDNTPFSIVATDCRGRIIAVSPALEQMLGYDRAQLVRQKSVTVLHEPEELKALALDEIGYAPESLFEALLSPIQAQPQPQSREMTYRTQKGEALKVNLTMTGLKDPQEKLTGYLFVAYDITEQKRAEQRITQLAYHDSLTGLPNRTLMQERLSRTLARIDCHGKKVGVILMDLDHFKRINDSLGHLAGDELLKAVSARLVASVRAADTVCRMGGDEFVLIIPGVADRAAVDRVCENIIRALEEPVTVGHNMLSVTPSLGYSLAPEDGMSVPVLIKHADIAMYRAKRSGRNAFQAFSFGMAQENIEALSMEQALRRSLEAQTLCVHYQPKVKLATMEVVGFEALLRWYDPALGEIEPDRAIPLAETTGLIIALGRWVLGKACSDIQFKRRVHGKPYSLAINVSPREFEHRDFISHLEECLHQSQLPATALELEITESMLLADNDVVQKKLAYVCKLGIKITIDDFGTGFSNLSYVANFPISTIKIDRCFMDLTKKVNAAIINAIVQIAIGMDLEVVAEGVESEAQLQFLSGRGCHVAQGFYFSKAVAFDALDALLEALPAHGRASALSTHERLLLAGVS